MLKIKLNFVLLCLLFMVSIIFIAFFVNSQHGPTFAAFVVIGNFAILKCKFFINCSFGAAVFV